MNTTHVDLNDENLINVHSIKLGSLSTLEEHFTPEIYVDPAISDGVGDSSLLRLDPNGKLKIKEQISIILKSTLTLPKTIVEIPTKSYVDKKFNDPRIIKTLLMLTSMIKNLITLDSLK